jgi:exopolysaccharide biosynthesis WecB/TagA/CpsF family protein
MESRREIYLQMLGMLTIIHTSDEYQQLLRGLEEVLGQARVPPCGSEAYIPVLGASWRPGRNVPRCMGEHGLDREAAFVSGPVVLSYINAHAYNLMHRDVEFKKNILQSDIVLRDGVGMAILLRLMKVDPGLNMNGTDFNPAILLHYPQVGTALLGTTDRNLKAARKNLEKKGVNIVACMDGFQNDHAYLSLLQKTRPRIILLGMGMPRQEQLAMILKKQLDFPCLILNGGAILDFLSGHISRAPLWLRALRCEWLYRLLREPKRLWKRYLLGNTIFLARAILLKCSAFRFSDI